MKKAIGALALTALFIAVSGSSASAAPVSSKDDGQVRPNAECSGSNIVYKTTGVSSVFTQAPGSMSSVTGGPGVTLQIDTTVSFEVSGSINATTSVSLSSVVASVQQDVGVTIGVSKTGTTTNGGSWTVPSDYVLGRLALGAVKYSGTTTQYLENSGCNLIKQGESAAFDAPAQEWSFQTSRVQ
ncbi:MULTISPECIES: hypothetical protein [Clavibacter]|uniref:hypothetical protein n=1 Tax=Clavibacter TaxID=1573 RepID=UPI001041FC95|nr:hypothetical protein [Clavibacter michiganensis]